MYHYNLNNVNFTAVPIIHFIDSHLIHNNGSSPHLHHATIFYPLCSRCHVLHQSTLQKCTINSRLPQPNFLNDFGFWDLSTLHGQWTCCWVRKNPITLKHIPDLCKSEMCKYRSRVNLGLCKFGSGVNLGLV